MATQDRLDDLRDQLRRGQISRRSFSRGLLALGITGAAATALLEACGIGNSGAGSSPSPPPSNVTMLGNGSNEITVWDGLAGADGAAWSSMLKAFTNANPSIRIKHTLLDWPIYYQKLPTSILGGSPPDLIVNDAYGMPQFASRNMLQPLDSLVFASTSLPKSDFSDGQIQLGTWNKKLYAIPLWNPTVGFWINNDLARKAGLDPKNPPMTASDFAEWAVRLTLDTSGKRADQPGFDKNNVQQYGISAGWLYHSQISSLWQFGGDVQSDDHTRCTLNSPEAVASLQYWVDLVKQGTHIPVTDPGMPNTGAIYQNQRLAMVVEGGWWLGFFNQNPQLLPPTTTMWGLPQWGPKQQAAWWTAHVMSIPVGVSHERAATVAKLIAFLSDASGPAAAQAGHLPARISQQNLPAVASSWWLAPLSKQQRDYGRLEWYGPNYNQINTYFSAAWGSAFQLQDSPQSALQKATNLINPVLAKK